MIDIDPIHAAQTYEFAGQDVPSLLRQRAANQAERPALIWEPKSGIEAVWTYRQLDEESDEIAAGLCARGVQKGDRVLIHADNCPETILVFYACAKIGAVSVVTNTRCVAADIRYFAEHTNAVLAITQPKYAPLVLSNAQTCRSVFVTSTDSGVTPELDRIPDACESFEALYGDASMAPARDPEPMLPVGIMYTSGTTSRPKAVVHTHANALWAGRMSTASMDYRSSDKFLAFLPLFHVNAMGWGVWGSLGVGAALVLQPKFSSSRFWEVIQKHQVTHCSVVSFVFKAIAAYPVPEQHSLRVLAMGVIVPEIGEWLKVRPYACWGMTEMVSNATRSCEFQEYPRNSIGKPVPGYNLAIVNPETGELCGEGETGELWVHGTRGVTIFLEYFDNEEANEKAFTKNGWFKTGDWVRLGPEGNFFFCDRDKDVLKVGGENVSALEVENCVREVPGVSDVAVVAKHHSMLDMVSVAFIEASVDSEAQQEELKSRILEHCKEKLADFKAPRAVYLIDALPRGTMDKVTKTELRQMAESMPSID
ncbi:MAG: acyl--CoA ligase [Halieaceae bacterium]|uniref:class I adenylate-forming enzyme family protein n=1 Tax=Haliea alexandrii TaxID=2448162 RepID=UPI000F0BAD1D|nr:class I adenylate-forming enzyme family protein [Haliea alexandrii]MCR9184015.1 acyl--CoA ligase [Halieaceae bacterium]